jgi:hypothetical protein
VTSGPPRARRGLAPGDRPGPAAATTQLLMARTRLRAARGVTLARSLRRRDGASDVGEAPPPFGRDGRGRRCRHATGCDRASQLSCADVTSPEPNETPSTRPQRRRPRSRSGSLEQIEAGHVKILSAVQPPMSWPRHGHPVNLPLRSERPPRSGRMGPLPTYSNSGRSQPTGPGTRTGPIRRKAPRCSRYTARSLRGMRCLEGCARPWRARPAPGPRRGRASNTRPHTLARGPPHRLLTPRLGHARRRHPRACRRRALLCYERGAVPQA